jgi:antitoxin YefM
MRAISHVDAQSTSLAQMIKQVVSDHTPLIITGENAEAAVLISLDDYNAWQETFYLIRNPANAAYLREAIDDIKVGRNLENHTLIED